MQVNEHPHTRQQHDRGSVCVLIAASGAADAVRECLESVREHTPSDVPTLGVAATAADVNRAIAEVAPADVALITAPCAVTDGWLARLREAARGDSNTATASALADRGTPLAIEDPRAPGGNFASAADAVAAHTRALRPRLRRAVGPCVYVRREAIELVGALDEQLDLRWTLDVDFAARCVLAGLAHVAADDVVVGLLGPTAGELDRVAAAEQPAALRERYPHLGGDADVADSDTLALALTTARGPRERLWVTIDASALDGALTGTHVHVLELIRALAHTGALALRVLVRERHIDAPTLALLAELPETEILAFERLHADTPRSTVFHRPQQAFSPGDVELAVALGERIVISQLDLIAYHNPGYFADPDAWQDFRRASRHGLSAAERVVVFSQHTRRELLSDALVDDARIRVVPPGLDHRPPERQQRPHTLDGAAGATLQDGFLLCLGTDFRHKNRVFALRLLAALRERHDWQGSLVLAGTHIPVGSSLALEREFMADHPELAQAVVALGPVTEAEKSWLIAHAGALVYPSAYEGFGLVPFESALRGVPCVFARQSSLGEEAPEGTAAIVAWDERASASATLALLADDSARERQVQALAQAAGALTWDAAARAMVEIYGEAASAPVRDAATLARDLVTREGRLSVQHELEVAQLTDEREHAKGMYDELNAQVGFGLSLIGPNGTLPDGLQRALLTLGAHPQVGRPLFALLSRAFAAARAFARMLGPR
jgi:glycosyltransferase involved in cell wall biosynthesis